MKKLIVSLMIPIFFSVSCFGATLHSMNKKQIKKAFLNKTVHSIPTDNLNGKTINNTFSMFMDSKGNIFGRMSLKPTHEPQFDKGTYTIKNNGDIYITWQHWDFKKKLCAQFFETKNAYIAVDCSGIFHTVYMKASIRSGNHLIKLNFLIPDQTVHSKIINKKISKNFKKFQTSSNYFKELQN